MTIIPFRNEHTSDNNPLFVLNVIMITIPFYAECTNDKDPFECVNHDNDNSPLLCWTYKWWQTLCVRACVCVKYDRIDDIPLTRRAILVTSTVYLFDYRSSQLWRNMQSIHRAQLFLRYYDCLCYFYNEPKEWVFSIMACHSKTG